MSARLGFAPLISGLALASALVLLGGCEQSLPEQLEEFADRICECEDETCARQVDAQWRSFLDAHPITRADEKGEARLGSAISRFARCRIQKLPVQAPDLRRPPPKIHPDPPAAADEKPAP